MKNPWLKKNPFMSMWLSGANAAAGHARAGATSAVRRGSNEAVSAATQAVLGAFWPGVKATPAKKRKRRR